MDGIPNIYREIIYIYVLYCMCNRQVVLLSVKEQDTNDQKHIREEAQTDMDRFDHQFDRKTKKSERFKGGLRRGEEAGGGKGG